MSRQRLAVLALLVLLGPALTRDAKEEGPPAPPAGTWKLLMRGRDGSLRAVWLLAFEKKKDAWAGKVLAKGERWIDATVGDVAVAKGTLRFTLKTDELSLPCAVPLGGDAKAGTLRGLAMIKKTATPIELRRTALATLGSYDLAREALAREPLGFDAVGQALALIAQAEDNKAKPAEVRAWAEKAVRSAGLYGPGWQRDVLVSVADGLGDKKAYEGIALQYARRAERSLEGKEPPGVQKRVLATLSALLERMGKAEDAKAVQARIAKLDFRIKPVPFKGRKGKSGRVALVELFSGSQAASYAAADLALDALAKTYKPTELLALRYHAHVPSPDPLVCPESDARLAFYADAIGRALPKAILDGKSVVQVAGARDDAIDAYEELAGVVGPELEKQAGAAIKLSATRKGDKLSILAEVSGLAKPGDDVRLRLALVEDGVRYKGASGVGSHSGVVRHMPGGADGIVLKKKEGKTELAVDLAKLKKDLAKYLKEYGEKRPFADKEMPLELKSLRVVAFVQDDKSGEVLQAAQAVVPAGKE